MSDKADIKSKRGMPSVAMRIAAAVLSLFLFLVVTELVLGFYEEDLYSKSKFFPMAGDRDFYKVFERDSRRIWRFRADCKTISKQYTGLVYELNSSGFRGPEVFQNKPDYRIVAIGNSCTFGWGISLEYTWTERLRKKLDKRYQNSKHEVINAGVPAYTSFQGKKYLFDELLLLQPDAVIITFGWNDHWAGIDGKPDSEHKMPNQALLGLQNLLNRTNLYRFMRKIILGYSSQPETLPFDQVPGIRRVPRREFVSNLAEIIDTLNQHGIQSLLVVPPVPTPEEYYRGRKSNLHILHEAYQEDIRLVALQTGTALVDLQPLFDQYQNLFPVDPIHYNVQGTELVSRALFEAVSELIDSSGN
ncbi:MAG: hypothetical protein IIA17_10935 [candidate division Zixibacteria bacterium]|nr:hypothetical protein [candidate division Zixibacteria bacterium]